MNTQHVPTNENELVTDLLERIRSTTEAMALESAVNGGDGFSAMEIAQKVEAGLPRDYPRPAGSQRLTVIHDVTASYITDLMKDVEGAIEWVPLPGSRPTPECPLWCTFHREDCPGCHYGLIVVNDIEIEVYDEPDFDAPRVDVSGYNWVNGPELTDLAEALHIAERLLSGPAEQVSA